VIDAILADDKQRPAKQRHTAKRIFDRLRDEHGFTGGYTIVKDYVRGEQVRSREMFVLTHAPGEAQADFGEALVVIAGVQQKAHYLVMDLPHSDDCFVAAFPAETTEAFLEGHVRAFAYFGGVPTRILLTLAIEDARQEFVVPHCHCCGECLWVQVTSISAPCKVKVICVYNIRCQSI
jgi:transposase